MQADAFSKTKKFIAILWAFVLAALVYVVVSDAFERGGKQLLLKLAHEPSIAVFILSIVLANVSVLIDFYQQRDLSVLYFLGWFFGWGVFVILLNMVHWSHGVRYDTLPGVLVVLLFSSYSLYGLVCYVQKRYRQTQICCRVFLFVSYLFWICLILAVVLSL
ncbi:hypothetical protein ACFOPX_02350 [Helicobacter baculiformis]|uniref:Uncharacterized protein n=1 Tax=Helicobacter baculiformis TaxID=427351 RepID=A0ABV7ZHS9_9HELI|nr:hypothetical protein [Helicobacter baculiformis]